MSKVFIFKPFFPLWAISLWGKDFWVSLVFVFSNFTEQLYHQAA